MSKKIIIALWLFAGINVWAQRNFREGYLITLENDTVYGWIDYRGDVRNARLCSFKRTEIDQPVDYSPSDIAAYRYAESKYYVSKNIGSTDAPEIIFLEYLVNGVASLYYYRDQNNKSIYYIEKDERLIELKVNEQEVMVDGKRQIKTVNSYIGILNATFNMWEMSSIIEKSKLEHSSLINVARTYHHYACTDGDECIIYEKRKPLIAVRIAPVVGTDLSTLKMRSETMRGIEEFKFNPSINLTVGVNLNFSLPRFNEKLYLQVQSLYTKHHFFYSKVYEKSQRADEHDIHVRSNILQTGLAIKYEYPTGKWRPTLAAGTSVIFFSGGTFEEIRYHYSGDVESPFHEKTDLPYKYMFGFDFIPSVHYSLAKELIFFLQAHYWQSYGRKIVSNSDSHSIGLTAANNYSFGLSVGIYF